MQTFENWKRNRVAQEKNQWQGEKPEDKEEKTEDVNEELPEVAADSDLEVGTEIEMEHTDVPEEAEKIAKDHIKEYKDYYKWLPFAEQLMKKTDGMSKDEITELQDSIMGLVGDGKAKGGENAPEEATEGKEDEGKEAGMVDTNVDHVWRGAAEGDKCGEKGCIRKSEDGWRVMSGKTGKYWPQTYKTKEDAEDALKRYHGYGFKK